MQPATTASPRRSRLLGCLIKGPLGCAAFVTGALVVLVAGMPIACGEVLRRELVDDFNARFEGSLGIADAWLFSVYSDQTIEGVILREPDGDEILRGDLRMPSLVAFLGPGVDGLRGPLRITLQDLRLVEEADGTLNVARALARREDAPFTGEWQVGFDGGGDAPDAPDAIGIELAIERLRWTSARAADGGSFVVRGFTARGSWDPRGPLRLEGSGALARSDGGGDGEGEGSVELTVVVDDLATLFDATRPVRGELGLALRSFDAALLDSLAPPCGLLGARPGLFVEALGPRAEHLSLSVACHGRDPVAVELRVRSAVTELTLAGVLDEGRESLVASAPREGREPLAAVRFTSDGFWTDAVVPALVPLWADVRLEGEERGGTLALRAFRLPLDADPARVSGSVELDLGRVSHAVAPGFRGLFGPEPADGRFESRAAGPKLELVDGVVVYRDAAVSACGHELVLDGKAWLATGELALLVGLPLELRGGGSPAAWYVSGTRRAPELSEPERR